MFEMGIAGTQVGWGRRKKCITFYPTGGGRKRGDVRGVEDAFQVAKSIRDPGSLCRFRAPVLEVPALNNGRQTVMSKRADAS